MTSPVKQASVLSPTTTISGSSAGPRAYHHTICWVSEHTENLDIFSPISTSSHPHFPPEGRVRSEQFLDQRNRAPPPTTTCAIGCDCCGENPSQSEPNHSPTRNTSKTTRFSTFRPNFTRNNALLRAMRTRPGTFVHTKRTAMRMELRCMWCDPKHHDASRA